MIGRWLVRPWGRDDTASDDGPLDNGLLDSSQTTELPWERHLSAANGYATYRRPWEYATHETDDADPYAESPASPTWVTQVDGAAWTEEVFLDDLTPDEHPYPFQNVVGSDRLSADPSIHDELPAHVLGAIDEADAVHFDAHLAICEECQAALQAFRHVVQLLPYGLRPEHPSLGARERLLELAREQTGRARTDAEPASAEAEAASTVPEQANEVPVLAETLPHVTSEDPTPVVADTVEPPSETLPSAAMVTEPEPELSGGAPLSADLTVSGHAPELGDAPEQSPTAVVGAPEAAPAPRDLPRVTAELLPAGSAHAELARVSAIEPNVSTTVVAVYVTPNAQGERAEERKPGKLALARRAESLTPAEMIAVGLAPLPTAPDRPGHAGGSRKPNVAALVWGSTLVFVVFAGLMTLLWGTAGPSISPSVALFSRLPGGQVLTMRGTGVPSASATLYVVGNSRQAEMSVNDLPPLPEGRVYQLWFVDSAQTIRTGGSFYVNQQGDTVARLTVPVPVNQLRSIAVTQEPAPNSRVPTGDHLIAWTP
ncbi:MAG: zf-HC2 domain-containing protein [Chloroflexota bacterium]